MFLENAHARSSDELYSKTNSYKPKVIESQKFSDQLTLKRFKRLWENKKIRMRLKVQYFSLEIQTWLEVFIDLRALSQVS